MISSGSSPSTGKRLWAQSMMVGKKSRGSSEARMLTICERGIRISRTCISLTQMAPSMMPRVSPSIMSLSRMERIRSSSSSRDPGVEVKNWPTRSNQLRLVPLSE